MSPWKIHRGRSRNRDIACKISLPDVGRLNHLHIFLIWHTRNMRVYALTEPYFSHSLSLFFFFFFTSSRAPVLTIRGALLRSTIAQYGLQVAYNLNVVKDEWTPARTSHMIRCNDEIIWLENESASIILWLTAIDPHAKTF